VGVVLCSKCLVKYRRRLDGRALLTYESLRHQDLIPTSTNLGFYLPQMSTIATEGPGPATTVMGGSTLAGMSATASVRAPGP
jgi:hypothetical protein